MNYLKSLRKLEINKFRVALSFCACVFAQTNLHAYTIHDAIINAHENNYQVLSEFENLNATKMSKPKAYAGFLPTAAVSSQLTKTDPEHAAAQAAQVKKKVRGKSLSVTQPIFSGGETYARIKISDNLIDGGQARYKAVSNEISQSAVTAYENVLTTREIFELSKKNEQVLATHLKFTKTRFEHGEVTKTDVLQSEARYASSVSEMERAKGEADSAKATFERVVGLFPNDHLEIINLEGVDLPENIDQFLEIAMKENPNLLASKFNSKATDYNVNVAVAQVLPKVSANATFSRSDVPKSVAANPDSNSYTLNLSVPIFQSGAEYATIMETQYQAKKAEYDYKETQRQIKEAVTRTWNNYKVAKSVIKSRAEAMNAAQKALEGVQEEYKIGTRTTLDVLDAEQEYFSTQVSHRTAQRDLVVASYAILQLIGAIDTVELGELES